jgi:type IV pilus modification protein PilV
MTQFKKNRGRGFTLLEVLVAVLVLSFGLLGIAGLLLASVQNNSVSTQRTAATFLAQDMADRMRSNINATKVKDVNGVTQTAYYLSADVDANANCFGTASTGCNSRQAVAARDLFVGIRPPTTESGATPQCRRTTAVTMMRETHHG